ncbi:Galactose oxidase/kelch repeat superfamily protein [Salvia divinorum]
MEDEIWKDFPEDLFEAVIARVPIATFFRFRSVCRKWNSLVSCESFKQQCAQVKHAKPWFYAINKESILMGTMYDPSLNKWHHPRVPNEWVMYPVASAGGLVCLHEYNHIRFHVCNPLTRSCKELPARSAGKPVRSNAAVGMTARNGGYTILWVGNEGDYQVFDSANNSWIHPGSMPQSVKLPLALKFSTTRAVSVEGTLYFMRSDPDGLLSYEVDTGMWRQYVVPNPHMGLSCQALAESGGRIMLVGLLTEGAASCVCIWELQMMTLLWKEVDRMPNVWSSKLYGKKNVRMSCLGNKTLLMLSLRVNHMSRLFTYDLSTREWLKLPGCVVPTTRTRKTQWIALGTAFHPCLTAIP